MADIDRLPIIEQKLRILERRLNSNPDKKYAEFIYDINGDIIQKLIYLNSAKIMVINQIDFVYDLSGNLIEKHSSRNNGQFVTKKVFSYDINGDLISTDII